MPLPGNALTSDTTTSYADEGRCLQETSAAVHLKAEKLRKALDKDNLNEAIKFAADVAAELRSNSAILLSPKAYYGVYLSVCDELRVLEQHAMESARRNSPIRELYERVQETPLVLPRLYLLITTGSVFVKSMQSPAKDVLTDLVRMCAGVQHPQRGLFLRAYLSQMMKDKLPDCGIHPTDHISDEEKKNGTVYDSIDFVIINFTEMNRLWVRMQRDCSPKEMELREQERLELRLLVGGNIATLSRLVGSNLEIYKERVLPKILKQIVDCQDAIAQEYLSDCVAQAFPDEFQLETLEEFMKTCGKLVKGVNIRTILVSMIDRLTKYAESSEEAAEFSRSSGAFNVFHYELPRIIERQNTSLVLNDRLKIYRSLMSFVLKSEADRMDYVDVVLNFCVMDIEKYLHTDSNERDGVIRLRRSSEKTNGQLKYLNAEDEALAMGILSMPVTIYDNVASVLKLEKFVVLQRCLRYSNQKSLAAKLLSSTSGHTPCIGDVKTLQKLFHYVAPLVRDHPRQTQEDLESTIGSERVNDLFNVASLTHHHEYLLALLPASYSGIYNNQDEKTMANGNNLVVINGSDIYDTEYEEESESELQKNQELVARIVYLCKYDDVEQTLLLYYGLKRELLRGYGKRLAITLPSLIFASLRLAIRCDVQGNDLSTETSIVVTEEEVDSQDKMEKKEMISDLSTARRSELISEILSFASGCVNHLPKDAALLSLRLHLHIAGAACRVGTSCNQFVYDSISAAFVQYEDHIASAREQDSALGQIIVRLGVCSEMNVLDYEGRDSLRSRAIMHASRALTRSDQTILLCQCAGMFRGKHVGDEKVARECLEKAYDVGNSCGNAAERVLLLLDVSRSGVRLHEEGLVDICDEGLLGEMLKRIRMMLSGRKAKATAVGKIAAARYQRLVGHIRSRLDRFEGLEAGEL